MTTRPEREQDEPKRQEERRKANEEKREEQELQLNDLAIGRRRFALIARIVVFVVVITMAISGHLHLGDSWIPLLAVGLMRA
jgi:fatty acid desaturase